MATINVADKVYVDSAIGTMVVGASVNGSGHLILTRENDSTFDAGDFSTAITNLINTVLASASLIELLITSNAVGDIPLRVKGMTGQTGDIQQWQNPAGSVLAKIDKDGKLDAVAIIGTEIDGALNTLTNIDAAKIDSHKVTVNTTAPSTPATGDIWINPSGS